MTFKAVLTRNLISLHHLDPSVLVQNPLEAGRDDGRYQARLESLPAEGTPITLILRIPRREEAGSIAPGERRIHWVVRGRVQGVGFRAFTQRTALILDLRGWVRNLPSGEVELVAQGPEGALKEFEEKITRGPRGSKVEHIEALETAAEEKLGEFTIRPSSE
ncbi:MAG: acylphosphatase [Planctomycetes bacterium]|nr:acylphosphatase [Planctomycetota bacterium]